MKLNKQQRKTLQVAVNSERETGNRKPIHCVEYLREKIDECNKTYATYSKSMYALIDAGIIKYIDVNHAEIVDINEVERLLGE